MATCWPGSSSMPRVPAAAARTAEQMARQGGDLPPLLGVPFGAKDIYDTAGLPTTAGFPPYASRVPPATRKLSRA